MVRTEATADDSFAEIFARSRLGMAIAAMIRIIVTAISNSMREKPRCLFIPSPNENGLLCLVWSNKLGARRVPIGLTWLQTMRPRSGHDAKRDSPPKKKGRKKLPPCPKGGLGVSCREPGQPEPLRKFLQRDRAGRPAGQTESPPTGPSRSRADRSCPR